MNGGGDINSLGLLPDKLKTELAIHVNLETLKKVRLIINLLASWGMWQKFWKCDLHTYVTN